MVRIKLILVMLGLFAVVSSLIGDNIIIQNQKTKRSDTPATKQIFERLTPHPNKVRMDDEGNIVYMDIPDLECTSTNLEILTKLQSLKEIRIYRSSESSMLDAVSLKYLVNIPNLTSLRIDCLSRMPEGTLKYLAKAKQIKSLSLIGSDAFAPDEYYEIAQMTNLVKLKIAFSTNFGDEHTKSLTNLRNLKSVSLGSRMLSEESIVALKGITSITNAFVAKSSQWVTNWTRGE